MALDEALGGPTDTPTRAGASADGTTTASVAAGGPPPETAAGARGPAAAAGVIASALALAVGDLIAGLTDRVRSLVVAVAEAIVDWTPGAVARWSIDLFGSYQKTMLIWGIVIISLIIGAAVGRAAYRRPMVAVGVFALFGIIGGIAAARVPGTSAGLSWLSAAISAAVGLGALLTMLRALRALVITPLTATRRRFLGRAGGLTLAALGAWMGGAVLRRRFNVSEARDSVADAIAERSAAVRNATPTAVPPTPAPTAAAESASTDGDASRSNDSSADTADDTAGDTAAAAGGDAASDGAVEQTTADAEDAEASVTDEAAAVEPLEVAFDDTVEGITPRIVPNDEFYRIDTALIVPQIDPAGWTMRIGGMVDNPIELTYQDLLDRSSVEEPVTLSCVSNDVGGSLVGNAVWLGVPLQDLLAEASVQPGADQLASRSVDGWTCGFPTAVLDDPGRVALVAVAMNGEPLPVAHGFPARLVVGGLYGYVSATKWISEIELTTWDAFDGYWIPRGWSKLGPIKTQSRIDVPRNGTSIAAGPQVIAGVAWAPHTGITGVEVAVDDGPWRPAELTLEQSVNSWRQWKIDWDATPGQHQIRVRATDASGYTQTAERTDKAPDGATGHHTINVKVG